MTIFPTGLAEIVHESGYKLFIDIGTTLQITNNAFVATARHYGIQLGNTVRGIGFDAQPHPVATRILGDQVHDLVDGSWRTFIEGQVPDAESVQALERRGDLHFTHPHWMEKDGQAQEATGTGGQGRSGRALARFALQRIRASLTAVMLDFRDYTRQENVLSESGREPEGQELPVVFTWDTPGGVAPGAIEVIKREVEDMARNLGVKVRFLIIGLALGSILPSNPVQGALNEEAAFRYLQADLAINIDY